MLGVSEEKFWDSIPIELDPYRKMDEMQQKRIDHQMWRMGAYVTNAVGVAVSNALNGRKSKAKYLEQPFSMMETEEQQHDPASDFLKFTAWATVYNENFKAKNRQG